MSVERILVVCAASDTALGRLIRNLTDSPVNHCFLLYQSALWGGWWAAQVGPDGVKKLPAGRVAKLYETLECYEYRGDLAPGLRVCRSMIGQGYDYLGIAGFLVKLAAWRLLRRRIKNPWHLQHAEFCSEFVSEVLKAAGVEPFDTDDPASLSPGDVRLRVMTNPRFARRDWPLP